MTGLMLWITSFNCCSRSLLLLLLNDILKVKAVYFKAECSACSAGRPPSFTSSTINFLGVAGPFSDEMGPSKVVWCNCHLVGCVGAFSQLLKCFSKLLARLVVLPQWGYFSFLMGSSQWYYLSVGSFETWYSSFIFVWFFQSNIPLVAQSVASPHQTL